MTRAIMFLVLCLAGGMLPATADGAALLSAQRIVELPFVPDRVAMRPDGGGIFVASDTPQGEADILALDPDGREVVRYHLMHRAATMLVSPDGERVVLDNLDVSAGFRFDLARLTGASSTRTDSA